MKRTLSIMLTCLVALALTIGAPSAAEAKKRHHKRDTPGCVSKAEYRAVRGGMTGGQIAALFDTWGSTRYYNDHGYYQGEWVDDGYWVNDGYWESEYDGMGNYIGEHWVDMSYWEDSSYWVDDASWVSVVDTVITYKKCRSFNRGRGRVAINFDNYSRGWLSGARVAYIDPRDPSFMDIAAYFRKGARLAGKDVPTPTTKAETPKPKATPSSPKPAPRPDVPKPTSEHATN